MTAAAVRVIWTSLTTAPVLLPLLLLRHRLLCRRSVKHCYLLWLILCLRLLVPLELPLFQPPVTVEIPNTLPALFSPSASALLSGDTFHTPAVERLVPSLTLLEALSLCWLVGMTVALCLHGVGYWMARRRLLSGAQPDTKVQSLLELLGGKISVFRSEVNTPITMGLLHPVILLPQDTGELDVEMVLRHELCHIHRRDVWYKGLFLLCACVHWFNPLVWRLAQAAGETVELCCDEDVVAGQNMAFRRRYGQSLLRAAADRSGVVLSTSFGSGEMKGRLMNLFATNKKGGGLLCTLCCAALCVVGLVGCKVSAAPVQIPATESVTAPQSAPFEVPVEISAPEGPEPETVWPVEEHYALSAAYGDRHHPITGEKHSHSGVDIPAEQGTLVLAAVEGTVTDCRFDEVLGNCVELTHADGCTTRYGCLQECLVEVGDCVNAGQVIGKVGATGQATGSHLHFELYGEDGHHADPLCRYPTKEFFVHHK